MPIIFPTNPSLNQIFDIGGTAYIWNGTSWTAWFPGSANSGLTITSPGNSVTNPSQIFLLDSSVTGSGNTANVLFTGSGPQFMGTFTGGSLPISINIPSTYNFVEIHFNGIRATGAGGHLAILEMNNDGGTNYNWYGRAGSVAQAGTDLWFNTSTNVGGVPVNGFVLTGQYNGGGTSGDPMGGRIYLSNLQNRTKIGARIQWDISWVNFNFAQEELSSGGGWYNTTSNITNITIYISNSSTCSGNLSAWGWPNE